MIHVKCPKCGDYLSVPESMAGDTEECPNCGNVNVIHVPTDQQDEKAERDEETEARNSIISRDAPELGRAICMVLGSLAGSLLGALVSVQNGLHLASGIWLGAAVGIGIGLTIGWAIDDHSRKHGRK